MKTYPDVFNLIMAGLRGTSGLRIEKRIQFLQNRCPQSANQFVGQRPRIVACDPRGEVAARHVRNHEPGVLNPKEKLPSYELAGVNIYLKSCEIGPLDGEVKLSNVLTNSLMAFCSKRLQRPTFRDLYERVAAQIGRDNGAGLGAHHEEYVFITMRQISGRPKNLALSPTCFVKIIGVLFTEDGGISFVM
jgi:hypothetical protein